MTRDWSELGDWWLSEVASDPTYQSTVVPLLLELLPSDGVFVDLGCGEGQVMKAASSSSRTVIGCDLNAHLTRFAVEFGPVVQAMLPGLTWLRNQSVDGCLAVLVAEHLPELDPLFSAAAEITRPGGAFVLVGNHPYVTAPGSASVVDASDGEVFWRWGEYLVNGMTHESVGDDDVTFHHRSMSTLLNAAASSGWNLRRIREVDLPEAGAGLPDAGLPRLIGLAWELSA